MKRTLTTWAIPILMLLVAGTSAATLLVMFEASGRVEGAADRLIEQTDKIERRTARMITITYTAATGRQVTVSTSAGDQLDGESTDMIQRQDDRLAAALNKWPEPE